MNLLIATVKTQGRRSSDFAWCIEGEIVDAFPGICDLDRREGPDGGCGCGRAFAGLSSGRATTTAMVAAIEGYTFGDLVAAVLDSRKKSGYAAYDADPEGAAEAIAGGIAEVARRYDAGTVLETRLGVIGVRP